MCGGNCNTCGSYTGPSCVCNQCESGGSFIRDIPENKRLPVRKPFVEKRNHIPSRVKMSTIIGDDLCIDCIQQDPVGECEDTSALWLETGTVICEQVGSTNTGFSLTELRDTNPCSETYNNTTFRRQSSVACLPQVDFTVFIYDITCNG